MAELLAVRRLSKVYGKRRWWGRAESKTALREVSFTLERGATLGVVGPSGSGKSTLARCLAGFEEPSSGEIRFDGRPLAEVKRGRIQIIFQQPAASLNPRFSAREIVEEPLVIQRRPRAGAAARAMELVGLPAASMNKGAHEFSGGERQRLAIARALVVEPELLILDESFAGLDPRLQEQIAEIVRGLGLSCIVIGHDLELVGDLAKDLVVMEDGAIVEQGPAAEVLAAPRHRLTRELVAAARALSLGAR